MASIKERFERLGLSEVRTYINSGNIVFWTPTSDTQQLTRRIEQAIEKETDLPIKVLVMSRAGLKRIVDAISAEWANDQVSKCDVMLLWKAVDRRSLV